MYYSTYLGRHLGRCIDDIPPSRLGSQRTPSGFPRSQAWYEFNWSGCKDRRGWLQANPESRETRKSAKPTGAAPRMLQSSKVLLQVDATTFTEHPMSVIVGK